MKFIIIFLVTILIIGILKKYKPYKETFINSLSESSEIYTKTDSVVQSYNLLVNNLWKSLFPNSNTYVEHATNKGTENSSSKTKNTKKTKKNKKVTSPSTSEKKKNR